MPNTLRCQTVRLVRGLCWSAAARLVLQHPAGGDLDFEHCDPESDAFGTLITAGTHFALCGPKAPSLA
jgi:hypothetical protein